MFLLGTNPLEPIDFAILRKSSSETQKSSEKFKKILFDLQILFEFNNSETKNEILKKDETAGKSSEINIPKDDNKELRKSQFRRTTVIPHLKPFQADSEAIPECSLRKNDFLGFKEHSEILFAFSSVLVKVMQPSAVRTIRLKPFSICLDDLQIIALEVRKLFYFILFYFTSFLFIFCIIFRTFSSHFIYFLGKNYLLSLFFIFLFFIFS